MELEAELHEQLGTEDNLAIAEKVLHEMLRRSPDQWSFYTKLFDLIEKRHGACVVVPSASDGVRLFLSL